MARRTKEEAEQTRNAILDAAEQVFFERGVARTTLEEIARAAGVTRGAVYWHFHNKVDLFDAMQARARLPQEDVIDCLLSHEPDRPLERLCSALNDVFLVMATDVRRRRVFTILFHRCEYVEEMRAIAQRKQDHIEQMLERSTRFFELVAQRGVLSPSWPPAAAARSMHALMIGLLSGMLEGDAPATSVAAAQECIMAFFRSLTTTPRRPHIEPPETVS